jgi:uncharacterized protein (TIGR00251 family)
MGRQNGSSVPITTLTIRVITRAKKNEISGELQDGTVKVRLTAPPVKGKANQALVKLLAEKLEIPASNIKIISGEKRRRKVLQIEGMNQKMARSAIRRGII